MDLDDVLRTIAAEAGREADRFRQFAAWAEPHSGGGLNGRFAAEADGYSRLASLWQERADAARKGLILTNRDDPAAWAAVLVDLVEAARVQGRLIAHMTSDHGPE